MGIHGDTFLKRYCRQGLLLTFGVLEYVIVSFQALVVLEHLPELLSIFHPLLVSRNQMREEFLQDLQERLDFSLLLDLSHIFVRRHDE